MTMTNAQRLILACLGSTLLNGCVAIPCGTQTFTKEYPTHIRATDEKPTKTYTPSLSAIPRHDGSVEIGLSGQITYTQSRVQHYTGISVTKQKRIAIGLYTDWAEEIYRPHDALVPVYWPYLGNGRYSNHMFFDEVPAVFTVGSIVNCMTLGVLPLPFVFFQGIFGPFEHGHHYLGKPVSISASFTGPGRQVTKTHDSRDLDLLSQFSAEDRKRIGAWTYRDDATHRQNTFWFGFTACPRQLLPWPGVSKFCTYVVHEPAEMERTTPVPPEIYKSPCVVTGPYGVFLEIPEIGFARTLMVPRGEKTVRFQLEPSESGVRHVQAVIRILPPSGGLEEAWNDDSRALLELAGGQDYTVMVSLPLPRTESSATGE